MKMNLHKIVVAPPIFFLISILSYAQQRNTVLVSQDVVDSFTRQGVIDAFITLIDSTGVMVDTLWTKKRYNSNRAYWMTTVDRQPQVFFIKAEHPEYESLTMRVEMKSPARLTEFHFPDILMKRRIKETTMQEVTVKATRVQLTYKGDTIVVDAEAFKIPEGSMLDALVSCVPGAELKSDGTIYMNGRKVDYLTLNGKDFFKGRNRIMLDNLPYYIVSKLKFFEKDVPLSQMQHADTGQKDYVMDVELKKEYSIGVMANAETGAGTCERWLGRLFGLRFTDNSRLALFSNVNNNNETGRPNAENSGGLPKTPIGEKTTKMAGASVCVDDKRGRFFENAEFDVCWTDDKNEERSSNETFLPAGSVHSRSQGVNTDGSFSFSLSNEFKLKKIGLTLDTKGDYGKQDGEGTSRSASFMSNPSAWGTSLQMIDSMFASAVIPLSQNINKVLEQTMFSSENIKLHQGAALEKQLPWGDEICLAVSGDYEKTSRDRYSRYELTYPSGEHEDNRQDRYMPHRNQGYTYKAQGWYHISMFDYWGVILKYDYTQHYGNTQNNLYRLDWLCADNAFGILPSQIDYLRTKDSHNSYQSLDMSKIHRGEIGIGKNHYRKSHTILFNIMIPLLYRTESIRYLQSVKREEREKGYWYFEPSAWFRFINTGTHPLGMLNRVEFKYQSTTNVPILLQMLDVDNTSNPLAITTGNPNLKPTRQHHFEMSLSNRSRERYCFISLESNIQDNMIANGFTYNPTTGVYVFKPQNVKGNWNARSSVFFRLIPDRQQHFQIEGMSGINYVHNVDLARLEGCTSSQLSRVRHYVTSQDLKLSYNKESLRLEAMGDFAWNVTKRELNNQGDISAFDFSYGLSGQYTFPWKIQLATDLKMYSRRGYEEHSMNTNELVWNASVSRPFLKGKLVVKVDGFDILGQLSSTRYVVNGQGRTETWQLSMPRYAMLRVAYKFNKNPKKKK